MSHLELGQAVFGNPTGKYPVGIVGEAVVHHRLAEIERVAHNWGMTDYNAVQWDFPTIGERIPGLEVRPYWWGEDDAPEAALPNLAFDGVEVRWYKHPGRGMTVNRPLTNDEWGEWAERLHDAIFLAEHGPDHTFGKDHPSGKAYPYQEERT